MKKRYICEFISDYYSIRWAKQSSKLLNVGPSAISNYITRGHLPGRAKPIIYAAPTAKGYQVRADDLEILAAPSKPPVSRHDNQSLTAHFIDHIRWYCRLQGIRDHPGITKSAGAHVTGVMTESAKQFITPLSFAALTGKNAMTVFISLTDEAEMGHIQLARSADLVMVAPATANIMARANAGIADDLATTILLATTAKSTYGTGNESSHVGTSSNKTNFVNLVQRGVHMIGPD